MEGESVCKKLSLPKLVFEYYSNKIVVTKLVKDAMDGIDPADDFAFLGPRFEYWEKGPIWLNSRGEEEENETKNRWHLTSDTGWVHYFNTDWTKKERNETFVKYVLKCVYDQPIVFHIPFRASITLCLTNECIMFGEKVLHIFDPATHESDRVEKYGEHAKRVLRGFIQKKVNIKN